MIDKMLNINEIYKGFKVTECSDVPEIDGTAYLMEHLKTGLHLVYLKRDDENKSFGIGFETLPEDSTGVFHILEHSVLCGSKEYPVKEPFVELLKSSMNTFLNAMTFPDKTVYPIASKNNKDFINLMRVYLDAVFYPLIYTKPEIFYQEGWHYEMDEKGELSYKGVVLNEMKGAYSDAERLGDAALEKALFPDTCYSFESGGDPSKITDLTYEGFIDSHRRFYAPSNGYIFLDGAMDIEEILGIIDGEYLSKFEKTEVAHKHVLQEPLNGGTNVVSYELGKDEDESKHTRVIWGDVLCKYGDRKKLVAAHILSDVLCGNNQSPLCKAILSEGLAEDVFLHVTDGVYQPWLSLEIRNLDEKDLDRVETVVFDTLKKVAAEGVDREDLEGALANMEFRMRERDYGTMPVGLIYGINMIESWMYGNHPTANLEVGTVFDDLKAGIEEGYFENLIKEVLLENDHTCKVILTPSKTLGDERRAAEKARLDAAKEALGEEGLAKIKDLQEKLVQWQNSEDSKEALETIPKLTLADLNREPERIPTEVTIDRGIKILKHKVNSNGIVYFNLYFDLEDFEEKDLSSLAFFTSLLGKMATENYTSQELYNKSQILCGNLGFHILTTHVEGDVTAYKMKLAANFSCLESNCEEAIKLIAEILTTSKLDENDARDILRQNKMDLFDHIVGAGASIAIGRVFAQISSAGVISENVAGYAFYKWMSETEKNWNFGQLSKAFRESMGKIICKENLTVSVTTSEDGYGEMATKLLEQILGSNGAVDFVPSEKTKILPWGKCKEGIVIPSDVAYAVRGGNLFENFDEHRGVLSVTSRIISLGYLWNAIRVQGGAYGTGFFARRTGLMGCYSYRDPNGAKSLESYGGIGGFLEEFCKSGEDLTGFIIGAISESSPILTPRLVGVLGDTQYWYGITHEIKCQRWNEIIGTTLADIEKVADLIDKTITEGGVCILGSLDQIKNCGEMDVIETL